jgi:potassium-transporting ATPase KdpC subunit
MRRQVVPAIVLFVAFTVLVGLLYPLVVLGIGQGVFPDQANGSLIEVNGKEVGSELIGQAFVDTKGEPLTEYFQSRPSAATGPDGSTEAGYDPRLSLGSNLGPTNPCFVRDPGEPCLDDAGKKIAPVVIDRVKAYRELNGLAGDAKVPVDAVTASGSGLDPHISVANARLQAKRVADERGLSVQKVLAVVDDNTAGYSFGTLGEKAVNVLELNLALDRLTS